MTAGDLSLWIAGAHRAPLQWLFQHAEYVFPEDKSPAPEIHRLKWQFSQDLSELLDIEIVFTLRRMIAAGRAKMDQEKTAGFQHIRKWPSNCTYRL